jgi:hypothetical protein
MFSYFSSALVFVSCYSSQAQNDSAEPVCNQSVVFDCENDSFNTGQMILSVQVPDWEDEYNSVQISLGRKDSQPLVGILYDVDTECGTLWEAQFRLFNVSCEDITTKEIIRVSIE